MRPFDDRGVLPVVGSFQAVMRDPSLIKIGLRVLVSHKPEYLGGHLRFLRLKFFVIFKSRDALHHNSRFPVLRLVRTEYESWWTKLHPQQIDMLRHPTR